MHRTEFIQLSTLWFVILIFLQTASGDSAGPVLSAIGIVAIALTYLIPIYLLAGILAEVALE